MGSTGSQQWARVLAFGDQIEKFCEENAEKLTMKDDNGETE